MNTCNVTYICDSHDFQFLPISRPTHSLMEQVWYDIYRVTSESVPSDNAREAG